MGLTKVIKIIVNAMKIIGEATLITLATFMAYVSAKQLYQAYLEITVLNRDYNCLYTALISSSVAYLAIYTVYIGWKIKNKKTKQGS